jgi:acyl-coenzyme A synthetase/AMP-(fatty) acid ligase
MAFWRPYLRTDDPAAVATALVQAFWAGETLTLLDPGCSAAELRARIGDPALLERSLPWDGSGLPADAAARWDALGRRPGGALRLFTAGTTGAAKAVVLDWQRLTRGVRRGPHLADAVWGMAYRPTHMAGVQVILQALATDRPLHSLTGLDRATALARIRTAGITHICATPTFLRLLLPAEPPLTAVRQVTCGGEPLDAALEAALAAAFPTARLRNVYAATETGSLFAARGGWFRVPEAMQAQVRFAAGRLWLHRDLLGRREGGAGRSDMSDQSAAWYDTGDRVEVNPGDPAAFRFLGRAGAVLNCGGYSVAPEKVEAVLASHPAIRLAQVWGRPSSVTGTVLCARCVAAGPPPADADLRAWLRERLPAQEIPRRIEWVGDIGATRAGKISRRES